MRVVSHSYKVSHSHSVTQLHSVTHTRPPWKPCQTVTQCHTMSGAAPGVTQLHGVTLTQLHCVTSHIVSHSERCSGRCFRSHTHIPLKLLNSNIITMTLWHAITVSHIEQVVTPLALLLRGDTVWRLATPGRGAQYCEATAPCTRPIHHHPLLEFGVLRDHFYKNWKLCMYCASCSIHDIS